MKISVITPSFNQAQFLPQTIESVLSQRGGFDLQYIIIDGGSTDGTLEVLEKINDPRASWISEKDQGQADAINKGLALATGAVLGWLNSDDLYQPSALDAVARAFEAHPDRAWLTGQCAIVDEKDQPIRHGVTRYKNRRLGRYSYRTLLRENYISQPATFWRRSAWERAGPLDKGLFWAMDYDLWLRLARLGDPIVLGQPLARFRLYGRSKTGDFRRRQYDEGFKVACRYLESDRLGRLAHRLNVEKIVLAYRLMRVLGR